MRIADLKRTMKVRVCVEDNMEDHPQAKGSKFWFVVVVVFVVLGWEGKERLIVLIMMLNGVSRGWLV